jgi:hypothetical protein
MKNEITYQQILEEVQIRKAHQRADMRRMLEAKSKERWEKTPTWKKYWLRLKARYIKFRYKLVKLVRV